jgi:hypothetical protein
MRVAGVVRAVAGQVLERDVAVNEVFGFVMRCALQSAGHTTDYVVEEGTALLVGGTRTDRLLELAKKAGYITQIRKGGVRAWLIVDDPEFIHMRLEAEIEWERQQRADSANPALTAPVRFRDGDACRYCRKIVNWRARKGKLAGTYDHREPGKPGTVDTLVVACGACNPGRRDRLDADERYPLLPAPTSPYYSALTAAFIAEHMKGQKIPITEDLRPGTQPEHASDPAPSRNTPQPPNGRAPVTTSTPTAARASPGSADPADRMPTESGSPGSGRVGTGQFPLSVSGNAAVRAMPPRRRSRRGRPR